MKSCFETVWVLSLIMWLAPVRAAAQPVTQVQFAGSAKIGTLLRPVTMRFACAMSQGRFNNFAVELDIPDALRLQPVFDVSPFEGPSSVGGQMHLAAVEANRSAQVDLYSMGVFGSNYLPDTTFTFMDSTTSDPKVRDSLRKLRAVADVLSHGPAKLTWRIENSQKAGQPVEAMAEISSAEAARAWVALAPCRGR